MGKIEGQNQKDYICSLNLSGPTLPKDRIRDYDMCFQSLGETFSPESLPSADTGGLRRSHSNSSLSTEAIDSPLRILSATLVDGGAVFTDINGAVRRDVATAWHGTSPLTCAGWLAATFVKGELSLSPHRGDTLVNGAPQLVSHMQPGKLQDSQYLRRVVRFRLTAGAAPPAVSMPGPTIIP